MTLSETSDAGKLAWIQDWNIEAAEPDKGSATSRLAKESVAVFKKILKGLSNRDIPQQSFRRFETSCSSLILWETGYGVGDGKLDEAFTRSRTLRRSILEPLVSISETLTDRLIPLLDLSDEMFGAYSVLRLVTAEAKTTMHEGYDDASESAESDSDASALESSDWGEIAEDLWTDTQCLLDLDPLIKSPVPDPVKPSEDKEQGTTHLKPYFAYSGRISYRFPKAGASLVDRLARANWLRFLKSKDIRDINKAARQELAPEQTVINIEQGTRTAPHGTELVSKFHDSGRGTSIHAGSAYAETVMSYRQKGRESVRVPCLPEEAKRGKPFDCVACGRKLFITNNSAWKKHLYLDLCPWVCHDLRCTYGTELFTSREDWIQHLALCHGLEPEWRSFKCPLCHDETGVGKSAISRHLSSHMEEISLAALPVGVESDNESDSDVDSASERNSSRQAAGNSDSGKEVNREEAVDSLSQNRGEDQNAQEYSTALQAASYNGNKAVVEILLYAGKVRPDWRAKNERTPLWLAAEKGYEAIVKLLLDTGKVNPDLRDKDGRTPLWSAAEKGHATVVKLLLNTGMVNPDRWDKDHRTPLWLAAEKGYEAIVKLLLYTGKVNPDFRDKHGLTPLWSAAEKGHEAVVKLLLNTENVNPDYRDKYGRTPLRLAAEKGHKAVVKLFLNTENVDPNVGDKNDRTPLWLAAEMGHEAVVKLLLNTENVDPNFGDKSDRTPLWAAAEHGHEAVVKLLLNTENINPNFGVKSDRTPLWAAADDGREAVVELLRGTEEVDLDPSEKTEPIDRAENWRKRDPVVKMEYGRNLRAREREDDRNGHSAESPAKKQSKWSPEEEAQGGLGGVVQYDSGKRPSDSHSSERELNDPPEVL
ncbi:hypothetical protein DL770_009053 [Monosporascus sp. CRB-9-2]|nr:hypothetical protein DL770_009053 [Monosporascus sp. CRB-9-2]